MTLIDTEYQPPLQDSGDPTEPLSGSRSGDRPGDGDRAGGMWPLIALAALLVALGAAALAVVLVLRDASSQPATAIDSHPVTVVASSQATSKQSSMAGMHDTMAQAPVSGEKVEAFHRVDPRLPSVPDGNVKKFRVDVYEHVTEVSDDLGPTRVWSYAVNGVFHRGTGVSEPIVVNQGDSVQIALNNGLKQAMHVAYSHSIDFHSAEVAPNVDYRTIAPGERLTFRFKAKHPGVFMYHCATDPVLMHTAAGMVGMMVVKPRNLAPVDRELWITQQEYYLSPRVGGNVDLGKAQRKQPDVIAFNGYANQYQQAPIAVKPGERIRMYVLNAGPSLWTAFHVIGTVFDRAVVEGQVGRDAQTISLAPSQGGWVEFTLDRKGTYPFVDHAFADMGKGAAGVLAAGVPAGPTMGH